MDTSSYQSAFIEDAKQYVTLMQESLSALAVNGSNAGALSNLHRAFHTLAGTAGTMQFKELSELCRKHEAAAGSLKESKQPVTPNHLKVWQSGIKDIEARLNSLSSTKQERI